MLRVLVLAACAAILGGCGLTETGAAAAAEAEAQAQQAAQAKKIQEDLKRQVEATNSQAVDRQSAAADAAAR